MAFSLGALIVDLEARTGKFETDMGRAAGIMKKRTAEIDRAVNKYTTRITKYVAAAVTGLAVLIIKNTKEADAALAQLDAAVKSTGGAAGFTTPQLVAMSKALQGTTIFADDAIQAMQSVLLTFTRIRGPEFEAAQQAITDISSRLGKDLQSSAILVGKALNDPIKGMGALAKAGIQFSESQTKTIKSMVALNDFAGAQAIILGELQTKFGGAAAAARDTFGGALSGLKNAFGDLFEVTADGTNQAKDSILGLTSVLQDPSVIRGIHSLTASIVTLIGKIGEAIAGLTILFTGKGGSAAVNLDIQIDKTKSKLDSLTRFGPGFTKQIRELQDEYDKLIAKQQVMLGLITPRQGGAHGGDRGGAAETERLLAGAVTAAEEATEAFEKQSKSLEKQIALFGKTGEAAKVAYDIASGALEDMHPSEQQHLLGLAQQYDWLVKQAKAVEDLAKEYEQLGNMTLQSRMAMDASRLANTSLVEGGVSGDEIGGLGSLNKAIEDVGDRAIPDMGEAFKLTVTEMSVFADQASRNIQSSLAHELENSFENGLQGMLKSFVDILKKMVAEAAAAQILKALFGDSASGGGLSNFLGGLFGAIGGAAGGGGTLATNASGGPIGANQLSLIGERGPELFRPKTAGTIIPNGGFGNTIAPVYNINIDSRADRMAIRQDMAAFVQENNRQMMKLIPDMRGRGANI